MMYVVELDQRIFFLLKKILLVAEKLLCPHPHALVAEK